MGCNCGGARAASNSNGWTYTTEGGDVKKYATEVEAKAAQIRAGGTGSVKPA